ncbi:MAG: hypothetical protein F9K32_03215 [Desulfobulbaceae bacterium]|nr:MAG: hypothetical protein F9K32_03215 [Desulfobulbaceae bacterium]
MGTGILSAEPIEQGVFLPENENGDGDDEHKKDQESLSFRTFCSAGTHAGVGIVVVHLLKPCDMKEGWNDMPGMGLHGQKYTSGHDHCHD